MASRLTRGFRAAFPFAFALARAFDAVDSAPDVPDCDALLLTVKAQQTAAALEIARHIQVRDFAASLQNGVLKEDLPLLGA